ncbi:GntR family transcriptional regulator [Novosphingobium album (ex Liu et al. 2023)]|uniref:GntR family transcriptional regulator n=1 Tax=Novosphingobium album (ex Liu et al. 2023) TaxID=3031130 RepID=A0ABT5WTJ6_9SPHN|nr:GntR family transcriptional regulator [Novosphingobium album (ex Liu et al. 2023)]MDE8653205.1 GntR family transcriptional regulator [Novosphingobium album (ex Liu et al. 2023)]
MRLTRTASLRDQVSMAVLDLLRSGELAQGARVTEEALAERFEVSRTPIREALARLAQQGILEKRKQGGYCVPSLSAEEISDIVAVRMLLEPPAIRDITKILSDRDLRELELSIAGQIEAAAKQNAKKFDLQNDRFRKVIFGSVPNKVLRMQIAQFDAHIHFMRAIAQVDTPSYAPMMGRQKALLEALKKRDPEEAEQRWKEYLHHTREWLFAAVGGATAKLARKTSQAAVS